MMMVSCQSYWFHENDRESERHCFEYAVMLQGLVSPTTYSNLTEITAEISDSAAYSAHHIA